MTNIDEDIARFEAALQAHGIRCAECSFIGEKLADVIFHEEMEH